MTTKRQQTPDVRVHGGCSVYLFTPLSPAARAWIEENVSDDCTWFGEALAVEHRYAGNLAEAMLEDGLVLR